MMQGSVSQKNLDDTHKHVRERSTSSRAFSNIAGIESPKADNIGNKNLDPFLEKHRGMHGQNALGSPTQDARSTQTPNSIDTGSSSMSHAPAIKSNQNNDDMHVKEGKQGQRDLSTVKQELPNFNEVPSGSSSMSQTTHTAPTMDDKALQARRSAQIQRDLHRLKQELPAIKIKEKS
jgi:hypothetical protein